MLSRNQTLIYEDLMKISLRRRAGGQRGEEKKAANLEEDVGVERQLPHALTLTESRPSLERQSGTGHPFSFGYFLIDPKEGRR